MAPDADVGRNGFALARDHGGTGDLRHARADANPDADAFEFLLSGGVGGIPFVAFAGSGEHAERYGTWQRLSYGSKDVEELAVFMDRLRARIEQQGRLGAAASARPDPSPLEAVWESACTTDRYGALDDLDPDGSVKAITGHLKTASVELMAEGEAVPEHVDFSGIKKKTILVLNKTDLEGKGIVKELLNPVIGDIPIHDVSCSTGEGVEELRQRIYDALGIVRVYTKIPGKKPDMKKPYVVARGTTILEFAAIVHKDFRDNLKFARVWGHARYDGQPVEKEYVLDDGDVVELHI